MTNDQLIALAAGVLNPNSTEDASFGTVGAAVVTTTGATFTGVCIDTRCSMGFCAEHAAIAAMVTAREYKIAQMVAVAGASEKDFKVVAPCGRCREFARQIHPDNLDTEVILAVDRVASLRDLLPEHEWPA